MHLKDSSMWFITNIIALSTIKVYKGIEVSPTNIIRNPVKS